MKPVTFDADRYSTPQTDAPHELAEAVNLIQQERLVTEKYDYKYWLKQVSACQFDHPAEEVRKLIKKLRDLDRYFSEKKNTVMTGRGGWLSNRLKELRPTQGRTAADDRRSAAPSPRPATDQAAA